MLLVLNTAEQTPIMRRDLVAQIWQRFQKTKKVHKMVLIDRKLKLREVADTLKISEGNVFTILHEYLSMKKLFSKWVPRLLTVDQKQQRVIDSERCLELF